jgi:hypothetical protein
MSFAKGLLFAKLLSEGPVPLGNPGIRAAVRLSVYNPLYIAGIRRDPPPSVPRPREESLRVTEAPSPPELPPALKDRLHGFNVVS